MLLYQSVKYVAAKRRLQFASVALISSMGIVLYSKSMLHLNSYRFLFFIYLYFLVLLSGIISKKAIRNLVVYFLFVELLLVAVSVLANPYSQARWLMPTDSPRSKDVIRAYFQRHQLLQVTPKPNVNFQFDNGMISHDQFGMRVSKSEEGEEFKVGENKFATVYGGSTVYEMGNSDYETWVSRLNQNLARPAGLILVNGGMLGYSSVEALIQTQFYNYRKGEYPVCNIYYLGWNDLRNVGVRHLDPGYENYWLRIQYDAKLQPLAFAQISPVGKVLYSILQNFALRGFPRVQTLEKFDIDNLTEALDIYKNNLRSIVAINQSRGVKTLFIPQVLNNSHQNNVLLKNSHTTMELLKRYNAMMFQVAQETGSEYISVKSNSFVSKDFEDAGHFTASGSRKFANEVSLDIFSLCGS